MGPHVHHAGPSKFLDRVTKFVGGRYQGYI